MASWVVELEARTLSDTELAYRLRTAHPAVVARVRARRVILDLRTVYPDQETTLLEVIGRVLMSG